MGHIEEYNSSEELQMAHRASVFAEEEKKKETDVLTAKQRYDKVLDKYIDMHSNTKTVRKTAKENDRTNDYQLDLSADIVDLLEKIKSELR